MLARMNKLEVAAIAAVIIAAGGALLARQTAADLVTSTQAIFTHCTTFSMAA
jgi:hypothetical protein